MQKVIKFNILEKHICSKSISDKDGNALQHLSYLPFGEVFANQKAQNSNFDTEYKFLGKELDAETGYIATDFRYYDPGLGVFLSVDPMAEERSWITPYNYSQNNPVGRSDKSGMLDDVDPTTSGYETARKAATPEYNKKGKQINKNYEPAFAQIFNEWSSNPDINVKFINDMSGSPEPEQGGTINYGGTDIGKYGNQRDIYNVYWDPSITKQLGAEGVFEEAKHLYDGLSGKFDIKNNFKGFSIQDELTAKIWVANNINIKEIYNDIGKNKVITHYGWVNKNKQNQVKLQNGLINGAYFQYIDSQNRNFGLPYKVFGTGGYK